MASAPQITSIVIAQLGQGEKRILGLVVAVRKALSVTENVKGSLTVRVQSALNRLVASKVVVQSDGLYSLSENKNPTQAPFDVTKVS